MSRIHTKGLVLASALPMQDNTARQPPAILQGSACTIKADKMHVGNTLEENSFKTTYHTFNYFLVGSKRLMTGAAQQFDLNPAVRVSASHCVER